MGSILLKFLRQETISFKKIELQWLIEYTGKTMRIKSSKSKRQHSILNIDFIKLSVCKIMAKYKD